MSLEVFEYIKIAIAFYILCLVLFMVLVEH